MKSSMEYRSETGQNSDSPYFRPILQKTIYILIFTASFLLTINIADIFLPKAFIANESKQKIISIYSKSLYELLFYCVF